MKLELKIFLAALKERRELDAILPDLLSAMDYDVIAKPGIGVRQFGVDIAAVGNDEDGVRKLFVFVVKEGNLNRSNWDTGQTAVRQSVQEVRDFYLRSCVPAEYGDLPAVICMTVGGEVDQSLGPVVAGFTQQNSTAAVSIVTWDGDRLAGLITRYMLREELLPKTEQAHFRKALAMVDTPDVSIRYFRSLVDGMFAQPPANVREFEKTISRLNVCLQVLFTWARDENNLDAPYQAGEYAMLRSWAAASGWTMGDVAGKRRALNALTQLRGSVLGLFKAYVEKLAPVFLANYALSANTRSLEYIDVNLRAFDVLGRTAVYGLWLFQELTETGDDEGARPDELSAEILSVRDSLIALIGNNPVLMTPVLDRQAIDIVLASMFLASQGASDALKRWLPSMFTRIVFAYRSHDKYPIYKDNYRTLLQHPLARDDAYRKKMTDASSLLPTLACWLAIIGAEETLEDFGDFAAKELGHCNFQLWLPNAASETYFWTATGATGGMTMTSLAITEDGLEPIGLVGREIEGHDEFGSVSAMRQGVPSLVLTSCRHFQIPVPPQFWIELYKAPAQSSTKEADGNDQLEV